MKPKNGSVYLYAITTLKAVPELSMLPGITDTSGTAGVLQTMAESSVAAVFSHFNGEKVRPERKNLAAHQNVLRSLMKAKADFLPAAFGVVAPSRDELTELLRSNQQTLKHDLQRVAGKIEMGLKVEWDVPNIFEFFVFRNPELAQLRNRLMTKPGGCTHEEKIEIGQTFEAILNETRERHLATVKRVISACAADLQADPPRDEKMVMNLACLIRHEHEKKFEEAVFKAAALFDDNYSLDYNGPWPPYHFVRASLGEPQTKVLSA